MMSHAGLATQVRALSEQLRVTTVDRHLLGQSLAFAASLRQMTVPLCNGASVVVASAAQVAEVTALFELVKRTDVTIMSFNPTFWRHCTDVLARLVPDARRALLDNRLRLLLSASEPLSPEVPGWWLAELGPRVQFVNMLGHTEVSGIATAYRIPRDGADRFATVLVGVPLTGVDVYVLNESLQAVPTSAAGEMYLGGPALTRGYLYRPDLTAVRLLPNPFSGVPGDRLYRTGDLVRQLPTGVIEHLGRIDDQLKVRGFRIEPAEIESALNRHPGVRTSVVVARVDSGSQRRLVAYVVPASEPAPNTSELRRHLRALLPEYLVPSVFVTRDALPLNANGKVDRRALPAPVETRPSLDEEFRAPNTALEHALADIWAEVLTMDRVGVHDSFFDLGGTSLSLTWAHQLLCERLEIELPIVKLFQYPTVHALAWHLSETEPAVSKQIERGRATAARRRDLLDAARARRRGPDR
jgi:aspartate racemase